MIIKCPNCGCTYNTAKDQIGLNATCSNCKTEFVISQDKETLETHSEPEKLSDNPFTTMRRRVWQQLENIDWRPPYIPSLTVGLAVLLTSTVMFLLENTVGLIVIVERMQRNMLKTCTARYKNKTASTIERSSEAICAGMMFILWFPFWLILSPLYFVGWLWSASKWLVILLVLAIILGVLYLYQYVYQYVQANI
jgi:hypothetical protein